MPVSWVWRPGRTTGSAAALDEAIPGHGHSVCFFDHADALVERLVRYATGGAAQEQRTIVIAEHHHIKGLRMRLAAWDLVHLLEPHDATWGLRKGAAYGCTARWWLCCGAMSGSRPRSRSRELWNRSLSEKPVPMLCAYPIQQVHGHPAADAVCGAHDHLFSALVA
jgi:hypothetical protein